MGYHLIFTPHDISGYTFTWLERYDKYIVGKEYGKKEGHLHYHIYIETDAKPDTVRDMAKSRLNIPSGQRGKESKWYAFIKDWKDPGYICKSNDIQASKGYTEKEIVDFVISGKNKYPNKVDGTPAEHSVTAGQKSSSAKTPRIPYQQQIISIAYAEWMKYKRQCRDEGFTEDRYEVIEIVCKAMREVSRGLNEFLLKDICNAVLFDDPDYREITLQRLKSKIQL